MTHVNTLYEEYKSVLEFLNEQRQPSLYSNADKTFKKFLILASASYFENLITEIIVEFITCNSNNNEKVISFVKNKAINRQYHTYFQWDTPNANSFFGLFGSDFKTKIKNELKSNEEINSAIKAFIEIGSLRNTLAHNNLATYNLDNKTTDEIFQLYEEALIFTTYVKNILSNPV